MIAKGFYTQSQLAALYPRSLDDAYDTPQPKEVLGTAPSKYHRIIKGVMLDYYDIVDAYEVRSSAVAHAIKKLLIPGNRHAKDRMQDLCEARDSIVRAIQQEQEKQSKTVNHLAK